MLKSLPLAPYQPENVFGVHVNWAYDAGKAFKAWFLKINFQVVTTSSACMAGHVCIPGLVMAISVDVQLVIQELSVRQVNTSYVKSFSPSLVNSFHALTKNKRLMKIDACRRQYWTWELNNHTNLKSHLKEVHWLTLQWPWTLQGPRHHTHVLLVSRSPKFHFISPYNHLFSRYIYLKYFELPRNDLKQPKVKAHLKMCNWCYCILNSDSLLSSLQPIIFRDAIHFKTSGPKYHSINFEHLKFKGMAYMLL